MSARLLTCHSGGSFADKHLMGTNLATTYDFVAQNHLRLEVFDAVNVHMQRFGNPKN